MRLDYELKWTKLTPVLRNDKPTMARVLGAARHCRLVVAQNGCELRPLELVVEPHPDLEPIEDPAYGGSSMGSRSGCGTTTSSSGRSSHPFCATTSRQWRAAPSTRAIVGLSLRRTGVSFVHLSS